MLVTLSEPKLAKKLIVSLTLRKPKIAMAEERMDRMIEMIRRVLAFLKKARKKISAVRMIMPMIATVIYLAGRILRRKRLTRRAAKEIPATQARILAMRFSLFLVDLGFLDIVSLVVVDSDSVIGFGSVVDVGSSIGFSAETAVISSMASLRIGSFTDITVFFLGAFLATDLATRLVVDLGDDFFLVVGFLVGLFEEAEDLVVFLVFFFTESIVLLILIL